MIFKGDKGTITLNFDSNSRAALFPPVENPTQPEGIGSPYEVGFDDISYEIIFSGQNEESTLESVGRKSVVAVVTPGNWEITVNAYIFETKGIIGQTTTERIMYAIGKETARVKPGQVCPVTVKMTNIAQVEVNIDISKTFKQDNIDGDFFDYVSYSISGFHEDSDTEDGHFQIEKLGTGPHIIPVKAGKWDFWVSVKICGNNYSVEEEGSKFSDINISPGAYEKIYFYLKPPSVTIAPVLYKIEFADDAIALGAEVCCNFSKITPLDNKWYKKAYAQETNFINPEIAIRTRPQYEYTLTFMVNASNPSITVADPYWESNYTDEKYYLFSMPASNVTITLEG
jgi:hypothetical protein